MASGTRSPETDVIADAGAWYPKRSGLRYSFVAAVEVVDRKSGRQITSTTANLSRSGCHVRTATPFQPGTMVKLCARVRGTSFESEGKVIYSISNEGMGIRFDHMARADQTTLNKWLMQASREAHALEAGTRASGKHKKIMFALGVLLLAAVVAGVFAWLGVLP